MTISRGFVTSRIARDHVATAVVRTVTQFDFLLPWASSNIVHPQRAPRPSRPLRRYASTARSTRPSITRFPALGEPGPSRRYASTQVQEALEDEDHDQVDRPELSSSDHGTIERDGRNYATHMVGSSSEASETPNAGGLAGRGGSQRRSSPVQTLDSGQSLSDEVKGIWSSLPGLLNPPQPLPLPHSQPPQSSTSRSSSPASIDPTEIPSESPRELSRLERARQRTPWRRRINLEYPSAAGRASESSLTNGPTDSPLRTDGRQGSNQLRTKMTQIAPVAEWKPEPIRTTFAGGLQFARPEDHNQKHAVQSPNSHQTSTSTRMSRPPEPEWVTVRKAKNRLKAKQKRPVPPSMTADDPLDQSGALPSISAYVGDNRNDQEQGNVPESPTPTPPSQHSSHSHSGPHDRSYATFSPKARTATRPPRRSKPGRTFVHHHLLRPSPPPPSQILAHLRQRPELLDVAGAKLLQTYARRVSDIETYSEVTCALEFLRNSSFRRFSRTSSVSMTLSKHRTDYRKYLRMLRKRLSLAYDGSQLSSLAGLSALDTSLILEVHEGSPTFDDDGPDSSGLGDPDSLRWRMWRPHPWAESLMPIRDEIEPDADLRDRLGRIHHWLLTTETVGPISSQWMPPRVAPLPDPDSMNKAGYTAEESPAQSLAPTETSAGLELSIVSPEHREEAMYGDVIRPIFASIYDIIQAAKAEGRGEQGTRQAVLQVLHLYIIYSSRLASYKTTIRAGGEDTSAVNTRPLVVTSQPYSGIRVLEDFQKLLLPVKPTRQTLHLLVQQVLVGHPSLGSTPVPSPSLRHTPIPAVESYPRFYDPPPGTIPKPEASRKIQDLRNILEYFRLAHAIFPGPATTRTMAAFALNVDDVELAKDAWDRWWDDMSRGPTRAVRWEGDGPRWDHRRKHGANWREVLQRMAYRGWVRIKRAHQISVAKIQEIEKEVPALSVGDRVRGRRLQTQRRRRSFPTRPGSVPDADIIEVVDDEGLRWFGWAGLDMRWSWTGNIANHLTESPAKPASADQEAVPVFHTSDTTPDLDAAKAKPVRTG